MRKCINGSLFLLFCSFVVVLTACSEEAAVEQTTAEMPTETVQGDRKDENFEVEKGKNSNSEQEAESLPQPITVNIIDPNTEETIKTIDPEEMGFGTDNEQYKKDLQQWAKEIARGTETESGYDQRNILDQIGENGEVIKGQPQVILEEAELVDKIIKASAKGGDVMLPLYVTASGYEQEEVPQLDEVVVASYTTYFNPNVVGRNKNIELSAQAIDNIIVGDGDHFSFNTTVGPSDEAHGYQPAQEAVNGKLVMGIGGGICQTSSTLFNAVDQLGVDYVEWHHHSVTVGYVPTGRDATVSYGGKDFRFLNTTGVPFLIKPVYGNGSLTVEIRTSKQYAEMMKKAI